MVMDFTENFLTALLEFLVNSDCSIRVFESFYRSRAKESSNASKKAF